MDSYEDTYMNEPEESSWSFYFEDSFCSGHGGHRNSLVSDAASSTAAGDHNCKKKPMSCRKRKSKGVVINDDALKDTASSPPNKVSYLSKMQIEKMNKQTLNNSKDKGGRCEKKERSVGERENQGMELKKRGLCLVPLSSLANYLS